MEVLAPVGGWEQLEAAVRAGADAVYLGAKGFNARRGAANFDAQGLENAVRYCHGRGVRVHVTVNTLITDEEQDALLRQADEIAQAGADAVIVQDLAVAQVFALRYPTIALHGSTQMSIHNAAGASLLAQMGFARAVLARELTGAEIAQIHQKTEIELEAFVHGALCMSVSGQCYLSCMLGGRSGNRGLCAQPCRLAFTVGQGATRREYALSLKDLSLIDQMDALKACGVSSVKIEGRMKRPEYVAAAVHACRSALAGEPVDMDTLRSVFSRDGFTDGYFTGRRNAQMFGYRSAQDAQASKSVYGALAALYRNEYPGVGVDMTFRAEAGRPISLAVSDGVYQTKAQGAAPLAATGRPMDAAYARRSLEKTGGTPFYLRRFTAEIAPDLFAPAAELGALRRQALEELLHLRSAVRPHPDSGRMPQPLPPPRRMPEQMALRVCLGDTAQFSPALLQAQKIHLPADQITPQWVALLGEKLVAELPVLVFPDQEEALARRLDDLRAMGVQAVCGHNAAAVLQARGAGLALTGGYGLNVTNSRALSAYRDLGMTDCVLSFEISARQAQNIRSQMSVGMMVYGHLPLMQLRSCPARGKAGCGKCAGAAFVTDRMGRAFPLWCHKRQYSTLLNPDVLYLADKLPSGMDFGLLYFTTESQEQCAQIFAAYQQRQSPDPALRFTRGMTNKALL